MCSCGQTRYIFLRNGEQLFLFKKNFTGREKTVLAQPEYDKSKNQAQNWLFYERK
jgi:hypothetical protein